VNTFWSLPGWGWVNLFFPLFMNFQTEQGVFVMIGQAFFPSVYLGIIVPLTLALLAAWRVRTPEVKLLGAATLLAVLLAMGDNFLLWRWLREVLPLGIMRFPVKALLLAAFTVPLLAAWGVRAWESGSTTRSQGRCPDWFVPFGLMRTALALAWRTTLARPMPTDGPDQFAVSALIGLGSLALVASLLVQSAKRKDLRVQGLLSVALLGVMAGNTTFQSGIWNPTIPASAFEPNLAAAYHASKGAPTPAPKLGESRVMLSPLAERALHTRMVPKFYDDFIGQRLAFWGNLNLLDGLPKVNGASTLVTREWNDVENFLYGTTNPAPANLMDFLSVTHTTKPGELMQWERRETAMPLLSAGQRPIIGDDSKAPFAYVDTRALDYRKVVLLPPEARPLQLSTNRIEASVRLRHFQPRASDFQSPSAGNGSEGRRLEVAGTSAPTASLIEIEAEAAAPTVLVIAQTFYPNWRATVNGQPAPVLRANHAFQAIPIPAGQSTIRLDCVDWPFRIGADISLLTLLGCAWLWRGRSPSK
jgi:hypothetical protein